MSRHWSEYTSCVGCGRRFVIGGAAEMRHRHNFPLLCPDPAASKARAERLAKEMESKHDQ